MTLYKNNISWLLEIAEYFLKSHLFQQRCLDAQEHKVRQEGDKLRHIVEITIISSLRQVANEQWNLWLATGNHLWCIADFMTTDSYSVRTRLLYLFEVNYNALFVTLL